MDACARVVEFQRPPSEPARQMKLLGTLYRQALPLPLTGYFHPGRTKWQGVTVRYAFMIIQLLRRRSLE